MENFTAYNPTRLHFGKDVTKLLGRTVKQYGKRVLLVYGQGSVKKYGYYDIVTEQLKNAGLEIFEYSGIKPNPVVEDVDAAAELGRKEKIDVIVALGGGSVIDSAKIMALAIASGKRAWDIMKNRVILRKTIPLVNILTLAATGTEMNNAAVVQNHETGEKIGLVHELNFPKSSFLDPQFTATVPLNYSAYGIADLIAHALEAYFGEGEASLTDRIIFSIIKDAMFWGPKLLNNPENYELRANIMLDATLALNGLTYYGTKGGDWGVHAIGHQLSLLYDTPHGASLTIAFPAWLKLQKDRIPDRIKKLGKEVFGTYSVEDCIDRFVKFFFSIKCPVSLTEIGLDTPHKSQILDQMNKNKISGLYHKLDERDYETLVNSMM